MIKKSLILIYILILGSIVCAQNTDRLKFVYKSVRVSFAIEENMFPSNWYEAPTNITATPMLDSLSIKRYSETIIKGLSKYHDMVLWKYLREVFFMKTLYMENVRIGGSYSLSNKIIYISNSNQNYEYTESTLHHEFSSILLESYKRKFKTRKWEKNNIEGFEYYGDAIKFLRMGKGDVGYDDSFNRIGFLESYSTSNLENDFNNMAEGIFMDDQEYWRRVIQFPRLHRKLKLTLKFYYAVDKKFKRILKPKYKKYKKLYGSQ